MAENLKVPLEEGWSSNKGKKWAIAGLLLLLLIFLVALVYALVGIANNKAHTEKHEERITVLEKDDSQVLSRIKSLEKTTLAVTGDIEQCKAEDARLGGEIKNAIKDHEERLHQKKPLAKHHASVGKQKKEPAKKVDTVAILARAIKSCADRGGELVSENGKVICVPKVTVQLAEAVPPKVVQLETSKVGTPCPGGGRSATYQMINGQLACLLDGVVQAPAQSVRQYRQEPEVVYVDRVIREERPPLQDEGYYEEDRGSSVLPWVIGAGALAWALNRHNTSAPATAVATGRPAVTTNPVGLGVVTGPAW